MTHLMIDVERVGMPRERTHRQKEFRYIIGVQCGRLCWQARGQVRIANARNALCASAWHNQRVQFALRRCTKPIAR